MFSITYLPPYSNGATRTQHFFTREDAVSMIAFYASCGTKAWLN